MSVEDATTDVVQFKEPDSIPALRDRVRTLQGRVPDQLIVSTHQEAQHATGLLSALAKIRKDAEADRKKAKQPVLDEGRFIDSKFKEVLEPLQGAEAVVKQGLKAYNAEQERVAREAEQRRREIEEQQARDAAAMAALTGEEAPSTEVVPAPAPEVPARPRTITAGLAQTSFRKNWKVEVQDVKALCAAVAAGEVPVQAVAANETFLRQSLMALDEKQRPEYAVPGVRFYQDTVVAAA